MTLAAEAGVNFKIEACVCGGNDFAFGITRTAGFAQFQRGRIGFVGINQILGELGRFAEANRQKPCGQRIEYAGMSGFFGTEQAPRFLQGGVAGKAFGFVEKKNAVNRAFGGFGCHIK